MPSGSGGMLRASASRAKQASRSMGKTRSVAGGKRRRKSSRKTRRRRRH